MIITISGIGGVGKGTTAKLLGEKLKYKVFSGGDFFRKKAEELGKNLYEFEKFVQENSEYDKELDLMQEKFGEENNNFILESRLG
jgi:cytidylate kinase